MSTSTRRSALVAALCVYSALLGLALLAPSSGTQSEMAGWVRDLGVRVGFSPQTATQPRAELLCNILILVPVSALGSLVWPRSTWRDWTTAAFVIACAVELTQGLLLGGRTASYADVVANTLGGMLGALLVLVSRRLRRSEQPGARLSRLRTAEGTPPSTPAAPPHDPDPRS